MFDIAWTEILIVAVIAIIVVGPKELPGMLRAFGKTFGQVRRTAREFQSTFNDALREAERQANLDEVKKDLDSVRTMDPTKDLRKSLDETKAALSGKVDVATPQPDTMPLNGAAAPEAAPADPVADPAETPLADGEPMEAPSAEEPVEAPSTQKPAEAPSAEPKPAPTPQAGGSERIYAEVDRR